MKLFRPLTAVLALFIPLTACAAAPTPAPVPTVPVSVPAEPSSPAATEEPAFLLPVTEEGIRTRYGWDGYQVQNIVPYEGDFLVEYGYETEIRNTGATLLDWVFGETGRQVQLTAMEHFTAYDVTGPGEVWYATSGLSTATPWMGLPQAGTVRVLGDARGQISETYAQTVSDVTAAWRPPTEALYLGFWDDGPAVGERWFQLYDARIDADGLSFSFIPNGDSTEKFQSFFPAVTTVPCLETSFDPDSRLFTLRFYHTALESGGVTDADLDWAGQDYTGLYPCAFPAGSLGRDSHFIADAQVRADGDDTVVTFRLTDKAAVFTVETYNLGEDHIPGLRLVFREK